MDIDDLIGKKLKPLKVAKPVMENVGNLKPHPRNYREHPADQLEHIKHSIREHGFYRNIVAAVDGTILAGHGVVLAAKQLQMAEVPVIRLNIEPDDPRALKVLAGDNMIGHLAEQDDRLLTELLQDLDSMSELEGTGFDSQMLAALDMVTRPPDEIREKQEWEEWEGMPEFESEPERVQLTIDFESEEARQAFVDKHGFVIIKRLKQKGWKTKWPIRNAGSSEPSMW